MWLLQILKTWEKIIFKSWKLIDALRASISLPGIFKPYEIDHIKYIDWWLKSNLPVLELGIKKYNSSECYFLRNWT